MSPFAIEVALQWGAVALYLAAAAVLAYAVIFGHPSRQRLAIWAVASGLTFHGAALSYRWIVSGHGPYMARYEVLSSNAWVAVAVLLFFLWRRPAWGAVGLVVLPVSLLAIAVSVFLNPEVRELPPTLRSTWLVFHVLSSKLAAGAFLLSVGTAALQLLRWRTRGRWAERLPASDRLDAFTVRLAGFGLLFWTIAIAAGAIWANQSWGRYWGWDPVETWSLVTWLAYGSFLHVRLLFRLKAIPTAWAAIGCFLLFVATILVLPGTVSSIHSSYFQ